MPMAGACGAREESYTFNAAKRTLRDAIWAACCTWSARSSAILFCAMIRIFLNPVHFRVFVGLTR